MKAVYSDAKEFYTKELLSDLRKLEIIRVKQLLRQVYILVALIVAFVGGMLLFNPFFILVILMILLGVYVIIFGRKRQRLDFKKGYKQLFLDKASSFLLPEHEFQANRYLKADDCVDSHILEMPADDMEGEGLVSGHIFGAKVTMSELHTRERERHADGSVTYTTLFHGMLLRTELPQSHTGRNFLFVDNDERFRNHFNEQTSDINTLQPEPVHKELTSSLGLELLSTEDAIPESYLKDCLAVVADFYRSRPDGCRFYWSGKELFMAFHFPKGMLKPSVYRSVMKSDDSAYFVSCMQVASTMIRLFSGS